jgi:hypothetical protein
MGGDRWGGMHYRYALEAQEPRKLEQLIALLCREVEYAEAGDFCDDCARLNVYDMLVAYFNAEYEGGDHAEDVKNAIKHPRPECRRCKERSR